MSTPSKRRKTNKGTPVKPSHGLDYFFGKQQQPQLASASQEEPQRAEEKDDTHDDESVLTDEQVARRLQDQWDREDAAAREAPHEKKLDTDRLEQKTSHTPPDGLQQDGLDRNEKLSAPPDIDHPVEDKPTAFAMFGAKNTLSLQSASADEDTISTTIPFDQNPLAFEPSEYIPQLQKQWALEGGSATYALLTRCFVLVNSTQSRIKIVDTLVNLLRVLIEGDPESLVPAVWLATNSISPPYIDLELGLGGSAISKALKKVCGLDNSGLKTLYNKYGDAGDVAFEAKKRQSLTLRKPKPLSIKSVFESLVKIASSKGQGSQEVKQRIVERLVQDARGAEESRYIVRTLVQHLRIGAVKTTMLIALSRAFLLSRPPGATFDIRDQKELAKLKKESLAEVWAPSEEIVKACFARHPNYNDLVPALLEVGICDELLLRCGLSLHIPLRPMLGNITRDLGDMLVKLQGRDFTCEWKYDGQRGQIHCDDKGKVTIFSRHLEVMTDKYPDLVSIVPKIRGEGVSSFILEGEIVAVDRESGDLKPFQILTNRARKDVVVSEIKVDVCIFAFDLMYLNGEELLSRPLRDRRELLRSMFCEIPHHFTWVKSLDATSADFEVVQDFFKQATEAKCEGVMVKVLDNAINPELQALVEHDEAAEDAIEEAEEPPPKPTKSPKTSKTKKQPPDKRDKPSRRKALLSTYEPDKRVDAWLKVKKDYAASADTLDLIPVGAWHGNGRKAAWWSPILLAVRNPSTGRLEAVTKCMSGFTDKFYAANRARYDPDTGENVIPRPAYIDYVGEPAVWFEPAEVWEVQFADITLSPTYTAALGLVPGERGLSTRFPRFLRVREDKSIEEATSSEELARLYRVQEARAPAAGKEGKVDADAGWEDW